MSVHVYIHVYGICMQQLHILFSFTKTDALVSFVFGLVKTVRIVAS